MKITGLPKWGAVLTLFYESLSEGLRPSAPFRVSLLSKYYADHTYTCMCPNTSILLDDDHDILVQAIKEEVPAYGYKQTQGHLQS